MDNSDIRILIVDDDPDLLDSTGRLLRREGYDVLQAASGSRCLAIVEAEHPDLILLDVMLPDIQGPEVCAAVRQNPAHRKTFIMMMSSLKISSDAQADGLDAGADGYIARPVTNRELLSRLNSMVRLIRAERRCEAYVRELEQALEKVKVLSGILPICMHCKQIRDDKGYWNRLEDFFQKHSAAQFSHSICDRCLEQFYPDLPDRQ